MADASRDENFVPTLLAVSNVDGKTPVKIYADPVTHRLLTSPTGAGSGDVVGPASATDNAIARFDTTTGKLLQNSNVTISDTGAITVASAYTLPVVDGSNTYVLTTNGAGVVSWAASAGGGNVTKVGTPVNNQVGVWTGDGTIEGDAALTFDTTTDTLATTLITATTVTANLVGNVTGNTSGSAGSVAVGGITGLGTGVGAALALNVGSAGAPVTFNGALGTPSSGTVTNLTGTASININGTVGATTPTTATFTTATINTSLLPDANDGAVLGASANGFSDLFFASGAVIGWNSSYLTATQIANALSLSTTDVGNGPSFELYHNSASPTGGDTVGTLTFFGKDSAANKQQYAGFLAEIVSPTSTSESGLLNFFVTNAGTSAARLILSGAALYPATNDAITLGTTTRQFSDLFLAEGGVINWDNGDATLTQVGNDVTLAGASLTARVKPRTGTTTSSATPTINTDDVDSYSITAQTVDITSFTTNLSGTPTEAQKLHICVTGTAARAITWGASFENGPVALPTTTVTTTRLDVFFIWNSVTSKWRCMASGSTV